MLIEKIRLAEFRNISELEIFPYEEMNVICGENAQGKTNLLEAIWLFCGMKSFRSSKDSSFINFKKKEALCELDFIASGVKNNAQMKFGEKRIAFLNEKALSNPSKLAAVFNAVIFSPNDISLIKDGPSQRRKFIDTAACQLFPGYVELLKNYMRAVMQRNQIIKNFKFDASLSVMLDVFEDEIAESGKRIIDFRKKYIIGLKRYIPNIYLGLSSGRENIAIDYICSCDSLRLKEKLFLSRKDDMYSGFTSIGPHRDDIDIKINGISARNYGSQGQKRSAALALKLSHAEILNEINGEYPVCLLDDVMSELDPERQNYILNHIKGRQSFITCCDPSNTEGLKDGKIIRIKNGRVI